MSTTDTDLSDWRKATAPHADYSDEAYDEACHDQQEADCAEAEALGLDVLTCPRCEGHGCGLCSHFGAVTRAQMQAHADALEVSAPVWDESEAEVAW